MHRAIGSPALLLTAALLVVGAAPAAPALQGQADSREVDGALQDHRDDAVALYRELLALPNDANHPADILPLVEWLEGAFAERGFATRRLETAASPLLLAERRVPGAERTALIYLQADGQPVDPSRWDQPDPYRAVLKERGADGEWRTVPWSRLDEAVDPELRVFARSAADSKGPIAQLLAALDVMRAVGAEPAVDLKVIIDTEEELGSPPLPAAVERYRDRLEADMLLIFDGPPHASGAPTLTFGARGIMTATLTAWGPRVPQHRCWTVRPPRRTDADAGTC